MIRRALLAAVALSMAAAGAPLDAASLAPAELPAHGSLQAAFAPWDDIQALITDEIVNARKQVLVQAYLLTDKKIAFALVAAYRRGVDVRVMADAEQFDKAGSSMLPELAAAGIPVWLETRYQNAHNKILVIDAGTPRATVLTGSFNFTWRAQHRNAENVLVARDNPALAASYAANWERHRQDATPYKK
jgi:phosphatidylserine/phosphatidylglycerophosphate/cardiolipin synthase-like enzyme